MNNTIEQHLIENVDEQLGKMYFQMKKHQPTKA